MALSPRLTARQTQNLTMTPELRQAIEILHMSTPELRSFIAEELERNPLIDTEPEEHADNDLVAAAGASVLPRTDLGTQDHPNFDTLAQSVTLHSHLSGQLSMADAPQHIRALAETLLHELDDDGYLRTDLSELAMRLGASIDDLEEALGILQMCEPTGVAARNLTECFALQLEEQGALDEKMRAFLERLGTASGAERLSRAHLDALTSEDNACCLDQIRRLNPAPGAAFEQGHVHYAVPEVTVVRNNLGGWSVELINGSLPAIRVDRALAAQFADADKEQARFVIDCTRRADWLQRAISQRAVTILKVASEIVRHQEDFFSRGVSHLRPLTMRQVAEEVKINESTVSRVVNEKYLTCERGTFELRFFFTKALRNTAGSASHSSVSIQDRIRRMIDDEPANKILSDDKIVKILNEGGVDIARRTVTKYREAMKIPSSIERRRFKAKISK